MNRSTQSTCGQFRRRQRRAVRIETLEARTLLASLIVNNTNDSGSGSLRQAILDSNASVGVADTIEFAISGSGPHTISVGTGGLPAITDAVTIDGYTQGSSTAGDPTDDAIANTNAVGQGLNTSLKIEIDGAGAGALANGFHLDSGSDGSTIRGLAIGNFNGDAVHVDSNDNFVEGNFIGTDAGGTVGRPNGQGIQVDGTGNTIGGTNAADRNLISGNASNGVTLAEGGNFVQGNIIGTDAAGTTALANAANGVFINSVANNTIGGTNSGAGNLISGNVTNGLTIVFGPSPGNIIQGNRIGTDVTGSSDLGNTIFGVFAFETIETVIGGTADGAGNLISGNDDHGVFLQGGSNDATIEGNLIGINAAGDAAIGNGEDGIRVEGSSGVAIGGAAAGAGNVISGNERDGIELHQSSENVIAGNLIGTDVSGTAAISNQIGVRLSSSGVNPGAGLAGNRIGGTTPGERNVISGGNGIGISIGGSASTGAADGNLVQGNLIGTDITGGVQLGNGTGVEIRGAHDNVIGGATAGARNIISGNGSEGIFIITGGTVANPISPSGNIMQGNYIGLDVTGSFSLGNQINNGITILGGIANVIGGGQPGAGNVISGNDSDGIQITDDAGPGEGNVVQGNLIGTDATGLNAVPNTSHGMQLLGNHTVVGGSAAGEGNVVSGNLSSGIAIDFGTGSVVENNTIGLQAGGGGPLGNGANGVLLTASDHTIRGNTIAHNGSHGVVVGGETGVEITTNIIFNNGALGIASGPQNSPVLTNVTSNGTTQIDGTLESTPNSDFRIELYANTERDQGFKPTGGPTVTPGKFGEGEVFLGSIVVSTDGNGDATFSATGLPAIDEVPFVTATATEVTNDGSGPLNNTSQFSAVEPLGGCRFTVDSTGELGLGTLREASICAGLIPGTDTIDFAIPPDDPRHFYYQDDGVDGEVTTENIFVTSQADDTSIANIDPDWPHSWFSIQLPRPLAPFEETVNIDGYTQPGSMPNTVPAPGPLNTVLKIEIDGTLIEPDPATPNSNEDRTDPSGSAFYFRTGSELSVAEGLAINNFGGSGIVVETFGGNQIYGNFIGIDVSGLVGRGNGGKGVALQSDVFFNRIGGRTPELRNLISSNGSHGILSFSSGGDTIEGNLLGTNRMAMGTRENGGASVRITGAFGSKLVTVGGMLPEAGNVITAGGGGGISVLAPRFQGPMQSGNPLENFAECKPDLLAVFQDRDQFYSSNDPADFLRTLLSGSRFITTCTMNGQIDFDTQGNPLVGNIFLLSGTDPGLAIDLGGDGVTPNDDDDGATTETDPDFDGGPNNLQNFPELFTATNTGGVTTVTGSLNSFPNTSFRIELFSNTQLHPSGFGGGENFLGFVNATSNADGDAPFTFTASQTVPAGRFITATATLLIDLDDVPATPLAALETSEFSAGIVVSGGPSAVLDVTGNGNANPFQDGIIIVRFMFGQPDANLETPALIPSDATRTTGAEFRSHLEPAGDVLDVNGDGVINPFQDGILIVRYLLGQPDANLEDLALIPPGSTRTTGAEIRQYLDSLLPSAANGELIGAPRLISPPGEVESLFHSPVDPTDFTGDAILIAAPIASPQIQTVLHPTTNRLSRVETFQSASDFAPRELAWNTSSTVQADIQEYAGVILRAIDDDRAESDDSIWDLALSSFLESNLNTD